MALRLNIGGITNATHDWTCKVQIVDISRERQSPEKKLRFQNLILEDEEEQQVRAVVYADDIDQYADKLVLLKTYLISTVRVKASSALYGRPIHTFYWILDKETALEEVKPTNKIEKPLPPPTKLNIIAFDSVARMTPGSTMEIDILGAVLRCGPLKYAECTQNRCREIIVADEQKNQFMLPLWDDFGEIEGTELKATMEGVKTFLFFTADQIQLYNTYKSCLSAGISTHQLVSVCRFICTCYVGDTESPENSKTFNMTKISLICAEKSLINSASVLGRTVSALGYIFSYGQDNNKDVYLLASSGIYKILHPSRCKYTCAKENAIDIATPAPATSPASTAVTFTGPHNNFHEGHGYGERSRSSATDRRRSSFY